jgi:hypothetical protein
VIITGGPGPEDSLFRIFPNPVADHLEVAGIVDEAVSFQLFDAVGRSCLISMEKIGDNYSCPVRHLSAGIYLLIVNSGSSVYRARVIKK